MYNKIVRPTPIYQQIAGNIEELIVGGSLAPGEKLPGERELAERFDVSRRALREGLRIVEQKGLIEIRKSGAFVRESSLDQLSEGLGLLIRFNHIPLEHLFEFRLEVDTILTRKAAQKATSDDIAALEGLIVQGRKIQTDDPLDWKGLLEVDLKIHLALARIAGNPIFEWVLRLIIDNTLECYENTVQDPTGFALDSFRDMVFLVEAIKKRDVKEAVSVIRNHVTILSRKYFIEENGRSMHYDSVGGEPEKMHGDWADRALTRKIEPAR